MCHLALTIALLTLTSCNSPPKNQWEGLDYSSVYRRAGHENDNNYSIPVGGCVDDDLGCR